MNWKGCLRSARVACVGRSLPISRAKGVCASSAPPGFEGPDKTQSYLRDVAGVMRGRKKDTWMDGPFLQSLC